MRRILGLGMAALLLGGCGPSAAQKALGAFQKAARNGNCMELRALVLPESPAAAWVENYCSPAGGMTVYGVTVSGRSAADLAAEMSASPAYAGMGLKRELESSEKQADGSLKLTVLEKVKARPSNFSKPAPPRRLRATFKKVDGAWKLSEYADEDVAQ